MPLVEWHSVQALEVKIQDLQETLVDQMMADPPAPPAEMLAMLKAKKAEGDLPDRWGGGGRTYPTGEGGGGVCWGGGGMAG